MVISKERSSLKLDSEDRSLFMIFIDLFSKSWSIRVSGGCSGTSNTVRIRNLPLSLLNKT